MFKWPIGFAHRLRKLHNILIYSVCTIYHIIDTIVNEKQGVFFFFFRSYPMSYCTQIISNNHVKDKILSFMAFSIKIYEKCL